MPVGSATALPPLPYPLGRPVAVPEPKVDEGAKAYAGRLIGSHKNANLRIRQMAEFYEAVRDRAEAK